MKTHPIFVIAILTLMSSCGQILKEVAGDQIIGTYSGKATFVYQHSLQNIGLNDETEEMKGTIRIFKNSNGEIFVETGDGNLKLSGITLASNGTTFSIPNQNVVQKDGNIQLFQGFQVAELEGVKYDGIYFSENNLLNFGYETIIKFDYWGTKADLSVLCVYEFSKLN